MTTEDDPMAAFVKLMKDPAAVLEKKRELDERIALALEAEQKAEAAISALAKREADLDQRFADLTASTLQREADLEQGEAELAQKKSDFKALLDDMQAESEAARAETQAA